MLFARAGNWTFYRTVSCIGILGKKLNARLFDSIWEFRFWIYSLDWVNSTLVCSGRVYPRQELMMVVKGLWLIDTLAAARCLAQAGITPAAARV